MNLLEKIYWIRLGLGVFSALLCAGYGMAVGRIPQVNPDSEFPVDFFFFLNSLSIALVVYLASNYLMKRKLMFKLEKPQKLVSTGIGIYFLSWLVFWVFLYTIIAAG